MWQSTSPLHKSLTEISPYQISNQLLVDHPPERPKFPRVCVRNGNGTSPPGDPAVPYTQSVPADRPDPSRQADRPAADPFWVIPGIMADSAVTDALSTAFGAQLMVPRGAICVLRMGNVITNLGLYLVAIAVGTVVTTVVVNRA